MKQSIKMLILFGAMFTFAITALAQNLNPPTMYRNSVVENTARYRSGNSFQKDFLLFMDMLKTTHPAFAEPESYPFDIDKIIEKEYQTLQSGIDTAGFRLFLQTIISPLNDGHTFVTGIFDFDNKKFFPLNIRKYGDSFFIRYTDKEYESILGKAITSINGIAFDRIIKDFAKYVSRENNNELETRVTEFMLLPELWKTTPYCRSDSALLIEFQDKTTAKIAAKLRKDMDLVGMARKEISGITQPQNQLFFYKIDEQAKICYLQFNQCADYNTLVWQIEMTSNNEEEKRQSYEKLEAQKEHYPKFDDLLKTMFSEIKYQKINKLVIDVRNNGGGHSALCTQLLSYLNAGAELGSGSTQIRISELFKQQYPEMFKKIMEKNSDLIIGKLYDDKQLKIEDDDENHFEQYFPLNTDSSLVFNGTAYFLQGRGTYSSAGDLLIMVRDHKLGKIIGTNSIYRSCQYGDILPWQLPNTGVSGGISHKYFTRPDVSLCDEETITPDVLIETTINDIQSGNDPCWQWVLEN